jgi:hypothetical protein
LYTKPTTNLIPIPIINHILQSQQQHKQRQFLSTMKYLLVLLFVVAIIGIKESNAGLVPAFPALPVEVKCKQFTFHDNT